MNILIYPARVETEFMDISSTQHILDRVDGMRTRQKKSSSINSQTLRLSALWSFDPHHLKVQQKKIIALSSSQLRLTIRNYIVCAY